MEAPHPASSSTSSALQSSLDNLVRGGHKTAPDDVHVLTSGRQPAERGGTEGAVSTACRGQADSLGDNLGQHINPDDAAGTRHQGSAAGPTEHSTLDSTIARQDLIRALQVVQEAQASTTGEE